MEIVCPICKTKTTWEGNVYRPFCSERCKLTDLGLWSEGAYSVPVEEADEGISESEG